MANFCIVNKTFVVSFHNNQLVIYDLWPLTLIHILISKGNILSDQIVWLKNHSSAFYYSQDFVTPWISEKRPLPNKPKARQQGGVTRLKPNQALSLANQALGATQTSALLKKMLSSQLKSRQHW